MLFVYFVKNNNWRAKIAIWASCKNEGSFVLILCLVFFSACSFFFFFNLINYCIIFLKFHYVYSVCVFLLYFVSFSIRAFTSFLNLFSLKYLFWILILCVCSMFIGFCCSEKKERKKYLKIMRIIMIQISRAIHTQRYKWDAYKIWNKCEFCLSHSCYICDKKLKWLFCGRGGRFMWK